MQVETTTTDVCDFDLSVFAFFVSVECGLPGVPWDGSQESYTDTTEGSEVFYRCDPGLVPEGIMRTVCSRNGWNPNPADLSCTKSRYKYLLFSITLV